MAPRKTAAARDVSRPPANATADLEAQRQLVEERDRLAGRVAQLEAAATAGRDQLAARVRELETELAGERQAGASPVAAVAAAGDASSLSASDGPSYPSGAPGTSSTSGPRRGRIVRYFGADPSTGEQVHGVGLVVDHDEETTTVVPLAGGYTVPHDNVSAL